MYHTKCVTVKTASIRELKHDTTTVLEWVAAGERVEIQKRGKPVAVLSRPEPKPLAAKRPDFMARLKSIYGGQVLAVTTTELLAEERGDR
jgi:antitoxin (DNA-binding transcriptional repressor) of toxin-antitoxin stability system